MYNISVVDFVGGDNQCTVCTVDCVWTLAAITILSVVDFVERIEIMYVCCSKEMCMYISFEYTIV